MQSPATIVLRLPVAYTIVQPVSAKRVRHYCWDVYNAPARRSALFVIVLRAMTSIPPAKRVKLAVLWALVHPSAGMVSWSVPRPATIATLLLEMVVALNALLKHPTSAVSIRATPPQPVGLPDPSSSLTWTSRSSLEAIVPTSLSQSLQLILRFPAKTGVAFSQVVASVLTRQITLTGF